MRRARPTRTCCRSRHPEPADTLPPSRASSAVTVQATPRLGGRQVPRAPAPPNTAATSTRRISPRHTEASAAASPVTGHCHFTANPCASRGQCLLTRHHMLTTRPVGTKPTTYKRSSGGCTCSAPTRSQQPRKKKEKKQVNGRQTTDGTVNTLRFQGPTRERGEPECTTERRRQQRLPGDASAPTGTTAGGHTRASQTSKERTLLPAP